MTELFEFVPSLPYTPPNRNPKKKIEIKVVKKKGRPNNITKQQIVWLIEDYFAGGLSILEICKRYKIAASTASRHIDRMLPVKSNDTIIISIMSKI